MADPFSFWMVYGMNQGAPTARHGSEEIAKQEAQRLARNNPGTAFYVLKAIGVAERVDVTYRDCVDDIYGDNRPF
jgi:hypothetical protein